MTAWKNYLEENQDRYLKELLEFLSIPSISSLKAHKADVEKAAEWVRKGAQPTDRVARFLSAIEVDGKPIVTWTHGNNPNKGEPGKKAQERIKEREEKAAAAAEAAAEAAAAPAEEAPAEEAPAEEAASE